MSDGPEQPEQPVQPVLPSTVTTDRLRLILVTHDDAADMIAGRRQTRWHGDYPRRDDVDAASMVRPATHPDARPDTWGPRHLVWEQLAVGGIGFFGPPVDGEVEVGYGLVADARGRGLVTEALTALLAETDRLGVRVRASVEPSNRASIRVLATAGFTDLRGSNEEGQLVMARAVASL